MTAAPRGCPSSASPGFFPFALTLSTSFPYFQLISHQQLTPSRPSMQWHHTELLSLPSGSPSHPFCPFSWPLSVTRSGGFSHLYICSYLFSSFLIFVFSGHGTSVHTTLPQNNPTSDCSGFSSLSGVSCPKIPLPDPWSKCMATDLSIFSVPYYPSPPGLSVALVFLFGTPS